ncbi:MAG: serine/threonine protein kinase [Polyangiaceae bacterium]|nr:serine/threonine protein kinase [Polyangiaceae bacterium]
MPTTPLTDPSWDQTEEGRAFLQQRVLVFARFGFALGFGYWLLRAVLVLSQKMGLILHPSMIAHLAGALSYLFLGLFMLRGKPSVSTIRTAEASALLANALAYEVMGYYIPVAAGNGQIMALALTLGFAARSIFVPSPARVTAVLCGVAGVPLLLVVYYSSIKDPSVLKALQAAAGAYGPAPSLEKFAIGQVLAIGAWWIGTLALCTMSSKIVYGLRHEVQAARKLGQYTLERKLGEGGMGAVYRARHAMLRRPTAIKLLLPDRAGAANLKRFEREVQLTAELTHPNTITIFDYGRTPDGLLYYAMELLEGANLETIVKRTGPMPPSRVVHVLNQVAGSLAEAHDRNLIHRDVKPANILLCVRGGRPDVAKVVDFGLVKVLDKDDPSATRSDIVAGTPLFLAPESISNPEKVDARSDLYSLGCVAFFLLTGRQVFEGNTTVEICAHHLHTQPEPPSQFIKGIPEELDEVVMQLLEKEQSKRPSSAHVLLRRLDQAGLGRDWTFGMAQTWWDEHADEVLPGEAEAPSSSTHTIDIDMLARRNRTR